MDNMLNFCKAHVQIGPETFAYTGKRMISAGWTLVMPWMSMKDVGLTDLDKHVGKYCYCTWYYR